MPFISDRELGKIQDKLKSSAASAKKKVEKAAASRKAQELMTTATAIGAAGAMGLIRGKMEDDAGVWNLPFVGMDTELIVGVLLSGSALFNVWNPKGEGLNPLALAAGTGITSHYFGQIMRKMSRAGKAEGKFLGDFSQVAGEHRSLHAPMHAQHTSRHADPVASMLAGLGY